MSSAASRILLAAVLLGAAPAVRSDDACAAVSACAKSGIEALQGWYNQDTGQWRTTNWWNAANATTVLVRYSKLTGSADLKAAIENTFARNSGGKFLNQYYDDEGWWALAWIDAYEWSHEGRYLEMAQQIFDDMSKGWDDTCGGGIWWRKDKRYKNAIANELFLSVAARLAADVPDRRKEYRDWAEREWRWFDASGMINEEGLVNDGLDNSCKNNHRNTWTYNQGVILGGLTALAAQSKDEGLLKRAQGIAAAAISHLSDAEGILHEKCEPNCGADGVQFKGIFVRNLAVLNAAAPSEKVAKFMDANARRICKVQTEDHRFSVTWSQASEAITAATQVSALDAILAAAGACK